MFERGYNLKINAKILLEKYHSGMINEGAHFRSELKRWHNFWERKYIRGNIRSIESKEKSRW